MRKPSSDGQLGTGLAARRDPRFSGAQRGWGYAAVCAFEPGSPARGSADDGRLGGARVGIGAASIDISFLNAPSHALRFPNSAVDEDGVWDPLSCLSGFEKSAVLVNVAFTFRRLSTNVLPIGAIGRVRMQRGRCAVTSSS